MNIEKKLFPESNKLKRTGETFTIQIVDAELDPIEVVVNEDDFFINCKEYSFLNLTPENLQTLLNAQEEVLNIIN